MLPHNHNINLATSTAEIAGYTEDDVLLSVFPLFHANAKYMTLVAAMVAGAKAIVNRRFSASRFWEQCRRENVTAFNGMGEMLRILMKQPEGPDDTDNTVRVVIGAAAPRDQVLEFENRFGARDPRRVRPDRNRADHLQPFDQRRAGSMGVPVPWYEVRVLDENDIEVPVGEAGEICIRPARPNVMMAGYWNNDSATLKSIRNLWFHTGDHGYRDADGFYFFKARETDSIRRRGENISAWEVERVLALHPELLESAVYGVPSPIGRAGGDGGDRAEARLDAHPRGACSTSAPSKMPHFAVPRYVRFVDSLPKSHAQRILKQELKAEGTRGRRRMGPGDGRLQGPAMSAMASARQVQLVEYPDGRGDPRRTSSLSRSTFRSRARVRCSCGTHSPRSIRACGCGCGRAVPPATSTRFLSTPRWTTSGPWVR